MNTTRGMARLHNIIASIPPKLRARHLHRGIDDLFFIMEELQDMHDHGLLDRGGVAPLACLAVMKAKVVYEIAAPLFHELGCIDIETLLDTPSELVHFPHEALFFVSPLADSAWAESFLIDSPEFCGTGKRLFGLTDKDGCFTCVLLEDGLTVRQCIEGTKDSAGLEHRDLCRSIYTRTIGMALAIAMFLCATDDYRDLRYIPVSGKKHRNKALCYRETGTTRVIGGQFASALARHHHHKSQRYGDSEFTGRTNRPHLRGGHFQRYWTGAGRKVPKVNFVHPCLVNATEIGDVEIFRHAN